MAQPYNSFWGYSAGLSFSFGTKVNRIGLQLSGYYTYAIAQVNSQFNLYYDFRSMGLKKKTPEIQAGLGLEMGFGREDSVRNNFVGLGENNMEHVYSVGYSWLHYWDKQQTSQSSGIFSINADAFRLLMENDLFGGGQGWRDRFRTGALLVEYQYLNTKFAFSTLLWTGDYSESPKIKGSSYPARYGYRSADNAQYGDHSLGLLSVQVEQLLPFYQRPRLNIGVDSEHIRNFFQNKLLHDLRFLPDKMIRHRPYHIPMIRPDGSQYLYGDEERVKRASLYLNLGLNNFPFY